MVFYTRGYLILAGIICNDSAGVGETLKITIKMNDRSIWSCSYIVAHQYCAKLVCDIDLALYTVDFLLIRFFGVRYKIRSDSVVGNINSNLVCLLFELVD
ncbi:hypothetical protein D3C78_1275290 [compost metagenome]